MRPGARIGIDVGTVRVGVSACDPDGVLATPVETVPRGRGDLRRIAEIVRDHAAVEVVVGLPRSLSGAEGKAAASVREVARALAVCLDPVPVRVVDERLSTVTATREMHAAGVSVRRGRASVDQAAAVVILQAALDAERRTGQPPGEIVEVER